VIHRFPGRGHHPGIWPRPVPARRLGHSVTMASELRSSPRHADGRLQCLRLLGFHGEDRPRRLTMWNFPRKLLRINWPHQLQFTNVTALAEATIGIWLMGNDIKSEQTGQIVAHASGVRARFRLRLSQNGMQVPRHEDRHGPCSANSLENSQPTLHQVT
jgi:hypothetical protein